MRLAIIIVTSNEQLHVKLLHTLLKLNAVVHNSKISCDMNFCDNDPVSRATTFKNVLGGNYDKTVWLEDDTFIPFEDIVKTINDYNNEEFITFCGMEKTVDWDQFKKYTKEETVDTEPTNMRGIIPDINLNFNPKKSIPDMLPISRSGLCTFVMANKRVSRKLKGKFKNTTFHYTAKELNGKYLSAQENLCRMLREAGVQMKTMVDCDVVRYFKHEHPGRILDTLDVMVRERPAE